MTNLLMQKANVAQISAARPDVSAWVSANAGSGKTRVLTGRVARLLLHGTEPQKILCLTFTKAAAAEMQNRLFEQLGAWAMLEDTALRADLAKLGEVVDDPIQLLRARTLFARALETPGGLKIQTIHAFCESLLHRFVLEAGVSPNFRLMDDLQAKALQAQVLDGIATENTSVFDTMVNATGKDPADMLRDILKNQQLFAAPFDLDLVAQKIGAEVGLTDAMILHRITDGFGDDDLTALAKALIAGGVKGQPAGHALAQFREAPVAKALDLLISSFLKDNGEALKVFPTVAVKKAFAPAEAMSETLKERIEAANESRNCLTVLHQAQALHDFATVFLARYGAEKAKLGLLEFEDLIRKTDALLGDSDMAQWVLYRLDGGIEHILVDEAQDTSPTQWNIVAALAQEMYAGSEGGTTQRTLFVVGDEKQSIFSFQGADPAEFARMKALFSERLDAIDRPLATGELLYSFRTASPLLQVVDKVYGQDVEHHAVFSDAPGRVEIWPFLEKPKAPEKQAWFAPIDQLPPSDPTLILAQQVADRVDGILTANMRMPGADRQITPDDFLILVQSRSPLFHHTIKELKSRNIPVAGADRLIVTDELAVKDLLAALRFANNPDDDLALAEVLRSPLCGLTEAELYRIAQPRKGTLWQAFRQGHTSEMLSVTLARADFDRPFELLEKILTQFQGRQNLIARLGPEAEDGIDELLLQALAFETQAIPSLTGFLEWIALNEIEVKRQMDSGKGQVRVMSVHGSKGLEAPIVILPQTVKEFKSDQPAVIPLGDVAVCGVKTDHAPRCIRDHSEAQKQVRLKENQRLLYVALTRAKTWLMIAGSGKRQANSINWYDQISEAVSSLGGQVEGDYLVWQDNWKVTCDAVPKSSEAGTARPSELGSVAAPLNAPKARQPSDLGGAHGLAGALGDQTDDAMLRGNLIHKLLEALPGVPSENRRKIAETLLANHEDSTAILDEALGILENPDLAHLFDKSALHEVPITADIPGLGRISGRVDVLLVDEVITCIDFKSNREIPESAAQIPEAYLRQMGAYHAALSQIWEGRQIQTTICWTRHAVLMEIPEKLTKAALSRAMSS